jgi:hypothetical protein
MKRFFDFVNYPSSENSRAIGLLNIIKEGEKKDDRKKLSF